MTSLRVRSLSFHASYRCRHSGACCTAGWPIPVEADRLARLRAALSTDALRAPRHIEGRALFTEPNGAPLAPTLLGIVDGACAFFDAPGHRCAIQRALGHDALPLACRQFPRVSVRDPRGVSITLSHYCPTAAALLSAPGPTAIVDDAEAFPSDAEYSGLDATSSLPPLLEPDMLMDWESWWEWERLAVETLADAAVTAEDALARLDRAVERVRPWRPSEGQLVERVRLAFAPSAPAPSRGSFSVDWLRGLCQIAIDAVPSDLRGSIPDIHRRDATLPEPSILKRYLAAHAFANWTAHLGRGLRSWLRSVEVAYALVRCGGDVRGADLILRHLADPARLAAGCSRSDEPGASNRAVDPV